jgi:hypothetical protein
MAVMMIAELPGVTAELYERVNEEAGIRSSADLPEGCLSHVAGPTDDGFLIVDVWESPEHFQRFVESTIMPVSEKLGLPQFDAQALPVHNRIPAGSGTNAGVLVMIPLPTVSTEQYDAMIAAMPAHVADGREHPAVSHAVAVDGEGVLVADVWGSVDEFVQFAENQVAPAAGSGMPPIDPRIVPVHNHLRADVPVAR